MKSTKKIRYGALALLCALSITSGAAAFARTGTATRLFAIAGRPAVKVMLSGTTTRDGNDVTLGKAGAVHTNDVLRWTITSENDGDAPALDYKTVGQIPHGTTLVAGSTVANANVAVSYSIDNGKTYATQPMIEERQADGTVKIVSAPIAMYTQVRYEWADALAAGGKLNASYKVRVK